MTKRLDQVLSLPCACRTPLPRPAPLRSFGRQRDLPSIQAFGQVEQHAACATLTRQQKRLLAVQGALKGAVVVGDDRRCWQSQCPLNLGPTVVVVAIVAIEDEGDPLPGQDQGVGEVGQGELTLTQTNEVSGDD